MKLGDHASTQGVNMVVHMGLDTAFTGRTDGVAAGLAAVAGTIGGYLSTKIGQWYANTPQSFESYLAHKVAHTMNGAGQGLIMGIKDGEMLGKAIGASTGALVAEVYADWAMPTGGSALPYAKGSGVKGSGVKGSGLNKLDHATKVPQTRAAAQFLAAATAFGLGMSAEEIAAAVFGANTALDHNFAPSAEHLLSKIDDI